MTTSLRVAKVLKNRPEHSFTIREVARELGLHYISVWRVMVKLEQEELVEEEQIGFRMRVFRWRN